MDYYKSLTKKKLIEIFVSRKLGDYSGKTKAQLITILKKDDDDVNRATELLYRKQREEAKRLREEKLARGEQVDAYPIIRVDEYNCYDVHGYILTRFNDKFDINENNHCSCFDTEYGEEDNHIYTLNDILNFAENNLDFNNPLEKNTDSIVKLFYDLILKHKDELLTSTEELEILDLTDEKYC